MALNALSVLALLIHHGQKPVDADEALRRSFDRKPPNNVKAVVEQGGPGGRGGPMKFTMWRDSGGRRRTEVVIPLAMQGRIFIDDGVNWTTFFPDTKVLRVHPAPSDSEDVDERMKLIKDNYRLEIDSKTKVAGRSAIRVVAHPSKSNDLETQRFYLDSSTFTPLKIETVDGLGNVSVQFVVRHIEFPKNFDKSIFDLPVVDGVRREVGSPFTPLKNKEDTQRRLGFRPAMPRSLPLGFKRQAADLMDWHGITPIGIRVSDGLVRLFVLQFKIGDGPPRPGKPGEDPKVAKTVGDIRVEVRGDGPVAVRERILSEFVRILESRARSQDPR
jgi:outer membrane lipoprotein-sorting protein